MKASLVSRYFAVVLERPVVTLVTGAALVGVLVAFIPRFSLDTSAESLVLADRDAVAYYRAIRARYGSDDFLVVAYKPRADLFATDTLNRIASLRDRIVSLPGVASVTTLLDVPLLRSPPVSLGELDKSAHTLLSPDANVELAREEFRTSPLYSDLLVGKDGRTTALRVEFERDARYEALRAKRDLLRKRSLETTPSLAAAERLSELSQALRKRSEALAGRHSRLITQIREVVDGYRAEADIRLAGIPLIVSDMIDFVWHDIRVFGLGALCFIVIVLALAFRRARWVVLPLALCAATVSAVSGGLGLADWHVTIVSSNFVTVLLIITLSLCVHLIVRYEELQAREPSATNRELVERTMRSKFLPSLYTALTTIVAFGSLTMSGLRPVADFGWIMAIGVAAAFLVVTFGFPAALVRLPVAPALSRRLDVAGRFTRWCASVIERRHAATLAFYAAIVVASAVGIGRLSVQGHFTDYFGTNTEIYRGMMTIDRQLGGTTPLDVLLDAPADYRSTLTPEERARAGITGRSYWLNSFRLDTVKAVHDYIDGLPETGKVLSLATPIRMLEQAHGGPLDNFTLSVIYRSLPASIRKTLFDPYLSDDGRQARFGVRIFETRESLDRTELLQRIGAELPQKFGLEPEQVHLTGMVVLYNNVLQRLFRSQATTLGIVFVAISAMFAVLFRSPRIALLATIPNLVAAGVVLGILGWLAIPLDIMTITIAAITLGIGVDDTIHYTHRYLAEHRAGSGSRAAIERAHTSIGRAMFYTSATIAFGFSIFAFSSFVPTALFGLLTGLAMIVALIANLTLLPSLLAAFGPRGPESPPRRALG